MVTPEAFFLPAGAGRPGQRFCLHFAAQGAPRGRVVFAHAFGEEMNKSRRMVSLQARALAQAGYAVLLVDLLGCGDSSGDFGDASWSDWIDDVVLACAESRRRSDAPLWLWGMRAGCLLAAAAATKLDEDCRFLFWQPPPSGRLLLQQFLRIKAAGDLGEGRAKVMMDDLRRRLGDGEAVDIVGYRLAAALAQGLERAELAVPPRARRLEWIEVSSRAEARLSPASAKVLDAWTQAGCVVRSRVASGPAFWQTIDIEEAPELLAATLEALQEPEAVTA